MPDKALFRRPIENLSKDLMGLSRIKLGAGDESREATRPRSNLGIKRVPFLVFQGITREPQAPKKGNKGLLRVLGYPES